MICILQANGNCPDQSSGWSLGTPNCVTVATTTKPVTNSGSSTYTGPISTFDITSKHSRFCHF